MTIQCRRFVRMHCSMSTELDLFHKSNNVFFMSAGRKQRHAILLWCGFSFFIMWHLCKCISCVLHRHCHQNLISLTRYYISASEIFFNFLYLNKCIFTEYVCLSLLYDHVFPTGTGRAFVSGKQIPLALNLWNFVDSLRVLNL